MSNQILPDSIEERRMQIRRLSEEERCFGGSVKELGSDMTAPFWAMEEVVGRLFLPFHPGEYGQCENRVLEIFHRIFQAAYSVPLAFLALPFAIAGHLMLFTGEIFGAQNVRYTKGLGPENRAEAAKILHLNACMMQGSLPLRFGGVMPALHRIEDLKNLITEQDPDIVLLCEIGDVVAPKIAGALNEDYASFYSKMGSAAFGMSSGLFVASKIPFLQSSFTPFNTLGSGAQSFFHRGFFQIELEDKVILYTHLQPGHEESDREVQQAQFAQLNEAMDAIEKPIMLIGDLNVDIHRDYNFIAENRYKWIDPANRDVTESCTDNLENKLQNDPLETRGWLFDYALTKEIDGTVNYIDTYNSETPLSDHKAILFEV